MQTQQPTKALNMEFRLLLAIMHALIMVLFGVHHLYTGGLVLLGCIQ